MARSRKPAGAQRSSDNSATRRDLSVDSWLHAAEQEPPQHACCGTQQYATKRRSGRPVRNRLCIHNRTPVRTSRYVHSAGRRRIAPSESAPVHLCDEGVDRKINLLLNTDG